MPRTNRGAWAPGSDRPDPLSLLQAQYRERLQNLLPVKHGRMVESPFAFLCGSAGAMAADLAPTPVTGLQAQLCGDVHLSSFGGFATTERNLVFDIKDLEPYLAKRDVASQAHGIVVNQRLMQAASDIFLGWTVARRAAAHTTGAS